MKDFSLILNTGIQFHELEEEVVIDFNSNVMKALRFFEFQIQNRIYLDPAYYFPMHDKYLRRNDLVCSGYLNPVTNEIESEDVINANMNWLDDTQLLSVNRLNVIIGNRKMSGLEQVENKWLTMPFYERDTSATTTAPTNWCRIKLIPVEEKCNSMKRVYKLIMALDTTESTTDGKGSPNFNGQPFKNYSLCGLSRRDIDNMTSQQQKNINSILIPLKVYEFCDLNKNPWLNAYLQEILSCNDVMQFPAGQRLKYLAFYTYLVTYLHHLDVIPDVKLYNDAGQDIIRTNLVLDIGNSRTFGLVAEDPLNISFSKSSIIQLRDLETGEVYDKPFDMRLCFKDERFGLSAGGNQFRWPSIVRLGDEALRNIYDGEQDLMNSERFDTNHSSPKRYLWDHKPYDGQWKFVSEKDRFVGPAKTVFMEGLMQQFRSDGSFTPDPTQMGEVSSFSRCSLMTFCFMEILLQVRMQINGVAFREKNGSPSVKREISRVILTCPTAMSRAEQITLRKCMEDASTALRRYYAKTYDVVYNPQLDQHRIEIVPSVKDLQKDGSSLEDRHSWNYDEATCCQMVYLYSEIRRYLGNSQEFFDLYGKRRNGERKKSLTIASIDIGAGTTDIMVCNYKNEAESVLPTPLFWDSFHIAGDDLVKRIITDVIIGFPNSKYHGASGIITAKLQQMGCPDISNTMLHFFGDGHSMGVREKRMRKEFCVQVLMPIANRLLDLLQKDSDDTELTYEDFFTNCHPSDCLMNFFEKQMGFSFKELTIKYSREYLNEIVCKVFEPDFRKFAAIFYTYKCDVVLMAGRPCSLNQVNRLLRRLYSVAPNRLISMNDYRVGSWYPGSSDVGNFGDKKSMVAVGALIAYLAEAGKLDMLKITTDLLKTKILPTTEYIGLLNSRTKTLENIVTPDCNVISYDFSAFPLQLGYKQIDVPGYPTQMLYMLDFNDDYIRERAISNLRKKMGLPESTPESEISPEYIASEISVQKARAKQNSPLKFMFERDYFTDKEMLKIESVENSEHDEIPKNMFRLSLQSWAEDESNWLDTGKFILQIGV